MMTHHNHHCYDDQQHSWTHTHGVIENLNELLFVVLVVKLEEIAVGLLYFFYWLRG